MAGAAMEPVPVVWKGSKMYWYVDQSVSFQGDGSKERPFSRISDAAALALPGDTVLVAPGVYREYVDPVNAGRSNQPYRNTP